MKRKLWMLLGLLATLGAASTASAQNDPAAAEALFQQGRAAADAGDFRTACEKFRESNRLDPAVGTLLNIADCEEKLGRVATAWTHFQEVAQRLPATDERRALAAQRAAALEPRLPKLTIKVGEALPEGSKVTRDGVELTQASFGAPLPVDPGDVVVKVEAPGHEPNEFKLSIAEGEQKDLEISAGDASSSASGSLSTDAGSPTLGYVLGGVGILGLVVGGVTGFMTLSKKSTADDHCPNQRCDAEGYDAVESGRTLGTVSATGIIAGTVLLAAGAYLVLSHDEKDQPNVALVPQLAPQSGGLGVWARF
ncbi:MAG: hypothetical protein H6718_15855 [Polyangiaceae bacterium]|nr:hypothetical protein [Myxococcales bacterium]MCB9586873.1 hypothetical protein [Polyangiaceae bacterium]MCB9608161.1 hypothetical protein [Polyangiaceae bacterium]